jgi:Leucine-rich repeat (LRR) protein
MAQVIDSIFPANRHWDGAVDDVSEAPADAVSIRLKSGTKNIERLPSFTQLTALWCFDIGAAALDAICACRSLTALYVENIKTADLSALSRLTHLNVLGLERCSKVTSLTDLEQLGSLQQLGITHFKNVRNLEPLARLSQLRALAVGGSMWTAMDVASFQPLRELQDLEYLHLTNIKSRDGSLEPLARLPRLRKLEIANFYSVSEFARLARRLPLTECQWFKPYVEVGAIPCKKCGASSMVMPSGKGATMICRQCDSRRLEKHIREWDAATAQA